MSSIVQKRLNISSNCFSLPDSYVVLVELNAVTNSDEVTPKCPNGTLNSDEGIKNFQFLANKSLCFRNGARCSHSSSTCAVVFYIVCRFYCIVYFLFGLHGSITRAKVIWQKA